ncbi:anillin isoform X1 [Drosophila tropicalis]|uniref:anillin isoform X1 n=1 Tax=Drosophila tropicalis TaxID=46794 RepID=UPI0035ABA389
MDPFTQQMLEKAEQRSRALGISNTSKFPLAECSVDTDASPSNVKPTPAVRSHSPGGGSSSGKVVVLDKATLEASPSKPLRHYAAVNKENMEMGIEINITTDKPIGVQVEIQEQDVTTDEDEDPATVTAPVQSLPVNEPLARLRDTSRNRLQRMGALYSNTDDLSSPIHRTEAQFHAGDDDVDTEHPPSSRQGKQRFGKLAALADTINQWEDDLSHHDRPKSEQERPVTTAPPKPDLPSRRPAVRPQQAPKPEDVDQGLKTKQLKWDPKVLSSLEAQGFQRRESSTIKHTYDYAKQEEKSEKPEKPEKTTLTTTVSQVAKTFNTTTSKPPAPAPPTTTGVKTGLVSGRAAIFENKSSGGQLTGRSNQKDPCELSLKDRMKLFETASAVAMLPKAPISSAPSISQIRQEEHKATAVHPVTAAAAVSVPNGGGNKPAKPENKLRDKVAALVANAQSTAESRIKDIDRQRQEDMQIIANRFNKQKDAFTLATAPPPPAAIPAPTVASVKISRPMPPPPPPPTAGLVHNTNKICSITSSKRRSPGDTVIHANEEDQDEAKRARKSQPDRLYPALSDLDSSGDNCCATVTASATDNDNDSNSEELDSCMDDEESQTETEAEDSSAGMCNGSLGREILNAVQRNEVEQQQQSTKKKTVHYADRDYYYQHEEDSSLNSSQVSGGIDDYLDEALDDDDETTDDNADHNASGLSLNSKGTTASNSFSYRKTPAAVAMNVDEEPLHLADTMYQTPSMVVTDNGNHPVPVKSELSVNQDNDNNLVTLVHTVSFYRRQQSANSTNSTPMRKICREEQVARSALAGDCHAKHKLEYDSPLPAGATEVRSEDDEDETDSEVQSNDAAQAQDKIKKLLSEVCKQQQVIGQASQALNLCAATVEFSGSTESVEGERYLLLATHRRQACLDEVQRLRVENSLRPVGAPKEKGLLTVKDITIPLRQEYVRKMATGNINGHHLVCLLKYNEHVLATKTVPTMPGLLSVKFPDVLQLNNVYADFRITLEIYGMLAQRDQLPHELKYHINLNKKSGSGVLKTPKKKSGENRLVMPPVQSPAGPHVVRTPQLVQYGFAIFSLREIQRTSWTLTQVLGVSPLEGVVHMKVNCELSVCVEYKGFLTMFEDISGFGAWHRRWCYLNGSVINYWKYPDDEKKKAPMGSIDLNTCISQKITTAPRDICARLNTMLLECERPAKDTDQESLIIVPNGRMTTVRHLLSADTREEREEWSAYFNKALTLLRAWGTNSTH